MFAILKILISCCNCDNCPDSYHNIAKQQTKFFKETKANLKFGECIIVFDFAENFSFLVQDTAQGFHWNNSQATIHLCVIYYSNVACDILHKSYTCISDHKTHDTVTVHSFLKHFYEHHISKEFPFLEKVFYFSDGSASQYKNFENLIKMLLHHEDFKLQAEWNFLATSYTKNACDGVGGTIKRLAAHVSLQHPFSDKILTPK